VPPHPDDNERLAIRRLPYAEAVAMALDHRISDAISMVSLLKLEVLRLGHRLPDDLAKLLRG
jgi:hypothetical protein